MPEFNENGELIGYRPVKDERLLTRVSENVILETAWGSEAVCLNGSWIVTYDATKGDFNSLERGAGESTYVILANKEVVK